LTTRKYRVCTFHALPNLYRHNRLLHDIAVSVKKRKKESMKNVIQFICMIQQYYFVEEEFSEELNDG